MSQSETEQNANMRSVGDRPPSIAAQEAVRHVASTMDSFTASDVINASPDLGEPQRDTVNRVLHSMAGDGVVSQRCEGSPYWKSQLGTPGTSAPDTSHWQFGPLKILHCYADVGVEAEALTAYGEVIRVGLNPRDTNRSIPIQANAEKLPFQPGTFDLGLFHPECARFSEVTSISGNPEDHPNQIPTARELGETFCDHYIIENKPAAARDNDGLKKPDGGSLVTLDGRQFGIPLRYERSFETSFPVDRRPVQQTLQQEVSPYFYADRSTEYWRSLKGYSGNYTKTAVAKNAVPRSFVDFLMREYLHHAGPTDSGPARSHHGDPAP